MLPYKNLINLDRNSNHPVFLQIVNQLILIIQRGQLQPSAKLPGSRSLSQSLNVHRNTVVKALEELQAIGWIEIIPNKGAFVVESLPVSTPSNWQEGDTYEGSGKEAFSFYEYPELSAPYSFEHPLSFDDGLPDIRLAPIDELARAYARNMRHLAHRKRLTYTDAAGNKKLKEHLVKLLNESRGLNIDEENIMITRGTIMAIHLSILVSVRKGDKVIVGESNYQTANTILTHFGAELRKVPVDENGLQTEAIEELCRKEKIRAIYLTSHHHHPTTVTLSPERRIQLLSLAERFNFLILEDDYDYDYHYKNTPILPLASAEQKDRVLYLGSFTKVLAPAFRVGYLVAPKRVIKELPKLRRLIDRQGDIVLEQSMGDLIEDGSLRRHLRKSWKLYKERRDYACQILEEEFSDYLSFRKPAGGMAIWTKFDKKLNLIELSKDLLERGLFLSSGTIFNEIGKSQNACRLGFASLTKEELDQAFGILRDGIQAKLS